MVETYGSGTIRWLVSIGAGILMTATGTAYAATSSLSGGIENRYSDNAEREETNEEGDLETRVNLNFQHLSDPGQCSSVVDMDLGYGYWHQDTFDPEVYTSGALKGECELAKGLVWQASDTISQVTQNSRQTDTPDNLTRKNVFRTGPVYTVQLTQVDQVQFSAAYENTEFEEPEEPDSNRVTGTAAYNHGFSLTLEGGLLASIERTELDTEEELDRESLSVTFNKVWATTQLSGSLGGNRLETRLGNQKVSSDGVTGSLTVIREISPDSEFSLNADRRLTDQTSTLGLQFEDFNFNLTNSTAVEVSAIKARYNSQFSSGSRVGVEVFADRSDYVQTGDREDRIGTYLNYSRPMTNLLTFSSKVSYQHLKFEDEEAVDELGAFSLALNYQLSTKMDVRSAVGHNRRTSDVADREYEENWVAVSLNYQFF